MTHPLHSAREKWRRGAEYVDRAQHMINDWALNNENGDPIRFRPKYDRKRRCLVFEVTHIEPFPDDLHLVIGDALSNLRAALDHVAWQLVKHGRKPNPKHENSVTFPLYLKRTSCTQASLAERLPGVLKKHWAVVNRHQPYQRGQRAWMHPLAVLDDLVRKDKHRQIVVPLAGMRGISIEFEGSGFQLSRPARPRWPKVLEVGTEALRLYGTLDPGIDPAEVDVKFDPASHVAFKNGLWARDELLMMQGHVHQVIRDLSGKLRVLTYLTHQRVSSRLTI